MKFYARNRDIDNQFQELDSHLLETSMLTEIFAKDISCDFFAGLGGMLHDLGKYCPSWQSYLINNISGNKQDKLDHATAGAQYLEKIVLESNIAKIALQATIMFHHGSGLPDMIGLDGESEFLNRLNKPDDETNIKESVEYLSNDIKDKINEIISTTKFKIDSKKTLFYDCGKKGEIDNQQIAFNMGLHLRNLSSCLIDADRTDSACFDLNETINTEKYYRIPEWTKLLSKLDDKLRLFRNNGTKLGKIRQNLSDSCFQYGSKNKGIYTCSAMTGAGKTLASLRFALKQADVHKMKKVFIIAPYTSILDQNADEIRNILEDENSKGRIVLESHSNLSEEKKNIFYGTEFDSLAETWDAPIIITTMVQFLETLFGSGTKKIRRMHSLANSVIVFDEIQTLPINCTYLFNWGIEYLVHCCGCSILLCTATQPGLDKVGNVEKFKLHISENNEIIKNIDEHYESLQRVEFIDKTDCGKAETTVNEVGKYIQNELKECNSFLAVVNTKPQAKELYEILKKTDSADYIYHLSTNMCAAHRKSIIREIKQNLKNNKKIICISTRLIEAGVDLSFGGALRYLAGLDSIVQTAGRCNRNGEMEGLGKVAIFNVENENLGSLQELKLGQAAMNRILHENIGKSEDLNLLNPKTIQNYFNYYYGSFPQDILEYKMKGHSSTVMELLSFNRESEDQYKRINNNKRFPLPYKQAFKTAWENFEVIANLTTGVIVPYGDGKNLIGNLSSLEKSDDSYFEKLSEILKQAQQYSVNIYSNQIDKLLKEGLIREVINDSGIYILNEGFYDENLGLVHEYSGSNISVLNF